MKKKKLVALAIALVSACTLATQGVTSINALTKSQEEALDAFQNIKKDFLEGNDDELSILDILYIKRDVFDTGETATTTTVTTINNITTEETPVTTTTPPLTLITPSTTEAPITTTEPVATSIPESTDPDIIVSSTSPMYQGIDVSKWQGTINWQRIKESGTVDFAIIRAGLRGDAGGLSKDAYFEYNYNQCKLYDIPVGCYWYTNATTVSQVQEEVSYLLTLIDGKEFEYPICFDIESNQMLSCSKSTLTDITIAFCDALQDNGYYVSIYSNPTWFDNYLDKSRLTEYDKWLANWTTTPKYGSEFGGLWQYKVGTCIGITGECDLDYSYRNYPYIIKSLGLNGF